MFTVDEWNRRAQPQQTGEGEELVRELLANCCVNDCAMTHCHLMKKAAAFIESSGRDGGCICHGNWRAIIKECEGLIGKRFHSDDGDDYTFFGVVHGDDDYYYGMAGKPGLRLLSCVGSIKGHGFTLVDAALSQGDT